MTTIIIVIIKNTSRFLVDTAMLHVHTAELNGYPRGVQSRYGSSVWWSSHPP